MCKTCGLLVEYVLKACGSLSTWLSSKSAASPHTMDNSRVIGSSSHIHAQSFTQLFLAILPLFEHILYPVSTAPITMKMR